MDYAGCLSHLAAPAAAATREDDKGERDDDRPYYGVVDPFVLDAVKLNNCRALARLADKAQVAINPVSKHVRTRARHTGDVTAAAQLVASITGLNVSLTHAGALGHDIGHLPFGHHGEAALGKILGRDVSHATMGVIVARRVERKGVGLNLTRQTLEIIQEHSAGSGEVNFTDEMSQEARIVTLADKISYVFADTNDFKRYLAESEPLLVSEMMERASWFGGNQRERTHHCIEALVAESAEAGQISFSTSECAQQFADFKRWLYKNAYGPTQKGRGTLLEGLENAYRLLEACEEFDGCDPAILLALLTDKEAHELIKIAYDHRRLPLRMISGFSIMEIYKHIRGFQGDFDNPWA